MRFKVVGYDSFDREEFQVGTYKTKAEALKVAKEKSGTMTLMYVYNIISGCLVGRFGSY